MEILIEAGANPHFKDKYNQSVMFYLCKDGKKQTVKYLMEKGCRIDEEDIYGQTPAFYVAS